MKRLVILAGLILALTSVARAQDPCPTCNQGRELVMTPTHNTEDGNSLSVAATAIQLLCRPL